MHKYLKYLFLTLVMLFAGLVCWDMMTSALFLAHDRQIISACVRWLAGIFAIFTSVRMVGLEIRKTT